ncbi:MAG TPA: hypothetical protein VGO57_07890 [Verrucomicrobiae bacterium]|jgi:hypothetical protein
MAILLKVHWVDKSGHPEPHQAITHIGGTSGAMCWQHTQLEAISYLERGLFSYYIEKDARVWKLAVALTADQQKHLIIQSDGQPSQSLPDLL